jgi:predicted dehydrogenase
MTDQPKAGAISRRTVLKGAAATAATAVAFPALMPSSASGAEKAAPSERITVGFIGIGKQASGHLDFMAGRTDVQVVAVCDVDKTRRELAKETVESKYKKLQRANYKGCDQYVDFRELLARKDIQAVVIGTPDHWHTIPIIEACKAKKDIYCEKPLTLTIHEAKTAIEAVRKHDVVFQTGSQQRSEGPFRKVVEFIHKGGLGKIKEVFVGIGATSKPCDLPAEEPAGEIEWDRWLGQTPKRAYNHVLANAGKKPNDYPFNPGWRDYREFSGGYVTDWGAHHFDITQWALQMDGSGPNEINPPESKGDQYGASFVYASTPVGDNIVVHHVNVVYEGTDPKSQKKVKETNGIRFVGEKGQIFVSRSTVISEPTIEVPELPKNVSHRENWLQSIRSRQRPVCDVAVGAGSVTVCHLVNLAYWHGTKMKWDPKKWEFIDGAGDNAWLDRPRREGYQLPDIA